MTIGPAGGEAGIALAKRRAAARTGVCAVAIYRLLDKSSTTHRGVFVKVKLLRCTTLGMVLGLGFSSAQADIIFSDKFEAYSLQGFGTAQEGWALTNSEIRSGNYAASYTWPPAVAAPALPPATDLVTAARHRHHRKHHRGGSAKSGGAYSIHGKGTRRSETTLKGGSLHRGKSYSVQFSNKPGGSYDTKGGAIVFQIHKRRAAGDPTGHQPIQLHTRNGHWVVSVHSNSAKGKHFDLGPISKSSYTDWKFNVRLSSGKDGNLQVSKNGKQVLNYHGPNDFNGKGDPYVKFGIYRPNNVKGRARNGSKQTIYYDQVRVSSN